MNFSKKRSPSRSACALLRIVQPAIWSMFWRIGILGNRLHRIWVQHADLGVIENSLVTSSFRHTTLPQGRPDHVLGGERVAAVERDIPGGGRMSRLAGLTPWSRTQPVPGRSPANPSLLRAPLSSAGRWCRNPLVRRCGGRGQLWSDRWLRSACRSEGLTSYARLQLLVSQPFGPVPP